jgi:hypothetical protein
VIASVEDLDDASVNSTASASSASSNRTWAARVQDITPFIHEIALGMPTGIGAEGHSPANAEEAARGWPGPGTPEEQEVWKSQLAKLSFNLFDHSEDVLLLALEYMFVETGAIEWCDVPVNHLRRFLLLTRASYRDVPFHNFHHAFNVCQAVYSFIALDGFGAGRYLSKKEKFCLLLASICHDLDHPGLNNSFQVAAHSSLAIRYNDKSVLEHHHSAVLFSIASQTEANVFLNAPDDERRSARKLIIDLIVATDLGLHKDFMAKIALVQTEMSAADDAEKAEAAYIPDPEHRVAALSGLIKCGDLCNEIRPTHSTSQRWGNAVIQEFFQQGDLELALGLEVGPLNDRNSVTLPQSQIGFINFLCKPLYAGMARIFPKMSEAVENLTRNCEEWIKLRDEGGALAPEADMGVTVRKPV